MTQPGSWFRGRPIAYDADARAIEEERQRWVGEQLAGVNELAAARAVDRPGQYRALRAEYERTGDLGLLRMALEYVDD